MRSFGADRNSNTTYSQFTPKPLPTPLSSNNNNVIAPSTSESAPKALENNATDGNGNNAVQMERLFQPPPRRTQPKKESSSVWCGNDKATIHFPVWIFTLIRFTQIITINILMYVLAQQYAVQIYVQNTPWWTTALIGTFCLVLWLYEEYKIYELRKELASLQLMCVWTISIFYAVCMTYTVTFLYVSSEESVTFAVAVELAIIVYFGYHLYWLSEMTEKSTSEEANVREDDDPENGGGNPSQVQKGAGHVHFQVPASRPAMNNVITGRSAFRSPAGGKGNERNVVRFNIIRPGTVDNRLTVGKSMGLGYPPRRVPQREIVPARNQTQVVVSRTD